MVWCIYGQLSLLNYAHAYLIITAAHYLLEVLGVTKKVETTAPRVIRAR